MALEKNKEVSASFNKQHANENCKSKIKKDKIFQTKVVIRRLPPTMLEEQFLEQISPIPDHDYIHFVKADMRLGQHAFSRAYINFTVQEDIFLFKEKFDGYVFLDVKGNEYPAVVEFAPFQKIPKKRSKKRDTKSGTIFQDLDYLKFLDNMKNPDDSVLPTAEAYLEEIESREKELKANNGVLKLTTPLIEYLKQRRIEQQKIRDEKREERKRKELEKKRVKEEERRRRKAEKDKVREKLKDKVRDKESQSEKEIVDEIDESPIPEDSKLPEPVVQVLKNPEREKELRTHMTIPKNKEFFAVTRSSNKERSKLDWGQERDKQRERIRMKDRRICEKPCIVREKERSRRDRIEPRTQQSENKKMNISGLVGDSTEMKHVNIEDNSSIKNSKDSVEDLGNDAQNFEAKWLNKSNRDNSCPGDVEPLGSMCQSDKSDCKQHKTNSSRLPNDDFVEVNENCKSEGGLIEGCDQGKDPRVDRRIRNKDRPSLEIYRPGMRRFSTQRNSPQKEISTSTSNSSTPSPSPTPPLITSSRSQYKDNSKSKISKNPSDVIACSQSQEDV